MKQKTICAAVVIILAGPALGHHSDAALEMNTVTIIEGTVTEYTLRNPHAYFVVETTNEIGQTLSWEVQMGSALSMSRRGWTADTLALGDRVVAGVRRARNGRPYGLLTSLEKEKVRISYERLPLPNVEASTTTLEGVWIVDRSNLAADFPEGLDVLMTGELTLTKKGQAAFVAFDQASMENPELSCITKPTPGGLVYTDRYPMQIEFINREQIIMIRVQYFDQERTVYMDGRAHPPVDERTHEGHSIGWWDGDTLVVDTTNFADDRSPYQNGVPSGAQKHVVERYLLRENGVHLTLTFTLEDPEYIEGLMTHTRDLRYSPHIEMTPFDCDLEATRRYLPTP